MKKCKSCQKEIDDKAKKCPHCQADQRNWFVKHKIITVILALVLVGIISTVGKGDNTDGSKSSSSGQKQEEVVYQIGDVITTDKLEITTSAVTEKNSVGSQYIKEDASEGATLIAVSWKYKNISDSPVGSFSQPSIKLVDSNGTEYDWDLGKSSTYATEKKIDSKVLSDLNPGITVTDAKVFEISKESYEKGGWKLRYSVGGKTYSVEI